MEATKKLNDFQKKFISPPRELSVETIEDFDSVKEDTFNKTTAVLVKYGT